MDIYDRIENLLSVRGMSAYKLSKETGISTGLLSQWKKRSQAPSADKLKIVADYFGVSTDYLLTGEQKEKPLINDDEELTEFLEQLRNRPECRMLFSLTKDATKSDVEKAVAIIEALRKTGDK